MSSLVPCLNCDAFLYSWRRIILQILRQLGVLQISPQTLRFLSILGLTFHRMTIERFSSLFYLRCYQSKIILKPSNSLLNSDQNFIKNNILAILSIFKYSIDDFQSFLDKRQKYDVKVLVNNNCSISLLNSTIPDYVFGSEDCYENFGFVSSSSNNNNNNNNIHDNDDINNSNNINNISSLNTSNSDSNTTISKQNQFNSSDHDEKPKDLNSISNLSNNKRFESKNLIEIQNSHQNNKKQDLLQRFKMRQLKSRMAPIKASAPHSLNESSTVNRNLKVELEKNQLLVCIRFEKLQESENQDNKQQQPPNKLSVDY